MQQMVDPAAVHGAAVTGTDAARTPLGRVERVYLDAESGFPTWALVDGARLGGHRCLVPLSAARLDGAVLRVPYSAAELSRAPHSDPGRELTPGDERELDVYYQGLATPTPTRTSPSPGLLQRLAASVPPVLAGDAATVVRAEERLHVGVRIEEVGVARLRRYVTTETISQTVPVTHEELVVDRQPIAAADAARLPAVAELAEQTRDVILHADRVVTAKDTVAVERIRLGTRTVTGQQTVTAQLAKENVVFDGIERTAPPSTPREGETA